MSYELDRQKLEAELQMLIDKKRAVEEKQEVCRQTLQSKQDQVDHSAKVRVKGQSLLFYVPFNSRGHTGTGPQHCHLWDSNSRPPQ